MKNYPHKLYKTHQGIKFDPTKHYAVANNAVEEAALRKEGYTDIATAMTAITPSSPFESFKRSLNGYGGVVLIIVAIAVLCGIWASFIVLKML